MFRGLDLVEGDLRRIPATRKVFHLSTVIFDHRERSPLGGVQIGDDMVANNDIEFYASEGPETFSLLLSEARRFFDRSA